ncbi:MAG: hypothetical protein KDE22_07310 [Rhodobacterales bacterium]|nr:hypothetical protein [Rhodobacterales bacterium]
MRRILTRPSVLGLAAALACGAALAAVPVTAQASPDNGLFEVTDSPQELEIQAARMMKKRLNIDPQLVPVNKNDPEDLRLIAGFNADPKLGLPRISVQIDTKALGQQEGKTVSRSVAVISMPDLEFAAADHGKLLEWINAWNAKGAPVQLVTVNNRLMATYVQVTYIDAPLSEDQVFKGMLGVVRAWPVLFRSLRAEGLVPG